MVNAKIHLALSFILEQFPFGPIISPIPGPTFEIADAEADKAVKKSNSKKLKVIDDNINNKIQIKKKLIIEVYVFSLTVFL